VDGIRAAARHTVRLRPRNESWSQIEEMNEHTSSAAQVYEIRFSGHLDSTRAMMFNGLEMTQEPSGETVLTGPVLDQAALHGVLSRIRDLGLPLLSVNKLPEKD
jgi:hypothetical protein